MTELAKAQTSVFWLNELIRAHSGLVPNDPDDDITGCTFKPGVFRTAGRSSNLGTLML